MQSLPMKKFNACSAAEKYDAEVKIRWHKSLFGPRL